MSHIPIIAACAYLCVDRPTTQDWSIPGSWVHLDAHRLKDLFLNHPNVRLCLSGHMHMVDTIDYLGVKYACNGAVSGNWWDGAYHEFHPGYAVVDLYEDGGCEVSVERYPWIPRA